MLQATISTESVNVADDDPAKLWHRRLGHMSEKGLSCLIKKNVLPDLKCAKLDVLIAWLESKPESPLRDTLHQENQVCLN